MREREKQELRAAAVLNGQFELLKRGCRATDFACREFLSLRLDCNPGEVVAAVHAVCHKMTRGDSEGRWDLALAAFTAGQQLLKGLQGAF